MDSSEFQPGRPSPRRELQGTRPTPLKVRKDSHKIKKPPMAPAPAPSHPPPPQQQPQHRPPVIIYAVSPKVIHTNPSDFMTLVQRLTGPSSSVDPSSDPSLPSPSYGGGGAHSPAARLATFEKSANAPDGGRQWKSSGGLDEMDQLDITGGGAAVDRPTSFPGILSPVPSSLQPISPSFFSPAFDPSFLSFLHEQSPGFGGKSFAADSANNFLASPNNFLSTPTLPSPGSYWDLFNQLHDS